MVRHQCHFQLRRGDFPRGWLRHFERAQEHRMDRLGEPSVHFVALGVVDRAGRRPLMLFGSAALAVIYIAMDFVISTA